LAASSQDAAVLRSVVALARTLHLSVTGEGVKTTAQQEHLHELGVEHAQGYLFAKPLPAEDIDALLAGQGRLPRAA
jgi:EAL domain-containing protein (putative c-di-GMP-specific phosphodiesterase class I)